MDEGPEPDENSYRERFLGLLNEYNSLRSSEYFVLAKFYEYGLWVHRARKHLSEELQLELDKVLTDPADFDIRALRCPRCGALLGRPARGHDGQGFVCSSCRVRVFVPKVAPEGDPGQDQVPGPVGKEQMKKGEGSHG